MVVKPLIVLDRSGRILGVSQIDEKGRGKSIETGILWHRYPGTGRLIPFEPEGSESGNSTQLKLAENSGIHDEGAWVRAVIDESVDSPTISPAGDRVDRSKTRDGSEAGGAGMNGAAVGHPKSWGEVLTTLWETVAARKREMPEGSYTTHLFESGPAKIRKKTGEEAVELILAESPEDITCETADLIYHLFVLLTEEGIDFDHIIAELDTRAR
jgi:phosphoribosyl-AMP cyclohydrolase / phosphoribosyl-ATP pyrophosphohydrolase